MAFDAVVGLVVDAARLADDQVSALQAAIQATHAVFDAAIVVRISMAPRPPYDPRRDLAPITLLGRTTNILVVANSFPEAEPGRYNKGSKSWESQL